MSQQERCPTCESPKKEQKYPYRCGHDDCPCVVKPHAAGDCDDPWHDSAPSSVAEQPREQAVEGLVEALREIMAYFPSKSIITDLMADKGLGYRYTPMSKCPKDDQVMKWWKALARYEASRGGK